MFQTFRAKTTRSHMALLECNSGVKRGRELFKGLKDLASLVVCNEKIFLVGGCRYFVSDVISRVF